MPYSVKVIRTTDFVRLKSATNKADLNSAKAALRVIGETCRAEGIRAVQSFEEAMTWFGETESQQQQIPAEDTSAAASSPRAGEPAAPGGKP
jgi:hypothetical protein